jgi:hypothetical protein
VHLDAIELPRIPGAPGGAGRGVVLFHYVALYCTGCRTAITSTSTKIPRSCEPTVVRAG